MEANERIWSIPISKDAIFKSVSLRTNYDVDRQDAPVGVNTDRNVILDDDRVIFDEYLSLAISQLSILLIRYMEEPIIENATNVEYRLVVNDGFDDNVLPSLRSHCRQFLIERIIEMWNKVQTVLSDNESSEIRHCLFFRKKPITRKIGPLW